VIKLLFTGVRGEEKEQREKEEKKEERLTCAKGKLELSEIDFAIVVTIHVVKHRTAA
jgi:hypothetical protein